MQQTNKQIPAETRAQYALQSLSVAELIRAVELLKQGAQALAGNALYASWIAQNPEHPLLYAVLFNHSVMCTDDGQLEAARAALVRAIELNPEFMPAYINLGRVYERLGNVGAAVTQFGRALERMASVHGTAVAHKTTALNQSARALESAEREPAAEELLRQSLELDPRQREVIQHLTALRQRQCEWPVIVPSERVSRETLQQGLAPLSVAALSDDPLYQLALAWNYNRLDVGDPEQPVPLRAPKLERGAPLRIGYLSSDLREHAVGYLLTEVLGLHDRSNLTVFAYYCGPESKDPLHAHFKATTDHFVDIGRLSDAEAARRIAADGIHILVDLNGYTRDARLKLVAMRPAPVIVNWLGFPGTMASPYHHYLIADEFIVPETHERFYSEKVVRLPCYQPSQRVRTVVHEAPSRAEARLPENAMVYCCFNGAHKIHPFTYERWLSILARVPDSVLWLLSSNDATDARLCDHAEARGVARERIVFAPKLANPYHLARYPLADLFLDTAPYGAHTTASDALWCGVPVLTFSGRSFASRVCGSLVRAAGIPELVCDSADAYTERAVRFGTQRDELAPYRARLRQARERCTLFDMPGLVRRLEELYRSMWHDHEAGQLPKPKLDHLDVYLELGSKFDHELIELQRAPDYDAHWREALRKRHAHREVYADGRLVTDALLAAWGELG